MQQDERAALQAKVAELEAELFFSRACDRLDAEADALLERAITERLTLARTVDLLLPLLAKHAGAAAVFVHTYDENLELRDFVWSADGAGFGAETQELLASASRGETFLRRSSDEAVLGQPLDRACIVGQRLEVAGEGFGAAALRLKGERSELELAQAQRMLDVWCEEIDNYLAAIAQARHKHQITGALSEALKHPVLDVGIDEAIAVLRQHVGFDDLILVYRHEDEAAEPSRARRSLEYKVIKDGALLHDSHHQVDDEVDAFLRERGLDMIRGGADDVPLHFGLTRYRQEVLINGVRHAQLVGRLVVASNHGEFNTFDRDLLERFADYLRQRIVDFNKEYKRLSLCFPQSTVSALLSTEDYLSRYLAPREQDVAVLFCDISGFTRISEQVLREPALIGKLIDTWAERAVQIIWDEGGVFDKMVGDCVIGLWGPPLFELDAAARCAHALSAAERIRDFTRGMGAADGLPQLEGLDPPAGVATGLNYCPLFVGLFGPNEDYTGFSSGMNNTARLQGQATRDQILCMDAFVATHGETERFGSPREARVKNVAEPLVFHEALPTRA